MAVYDQLEDLYRTYSGDVYRFLYSMCRNTETAEDLLQTTFLRVANGLAAFRGDCTVKTWIFTIARREYFRWQKKNPPTVPLDDTFPVADNTQQDYDRRESAAAILAYLDSLGEPRRTLMRLRLAGGLSFKEIGAVLDKTEIWARVTFSRTKQRLLEEMREELE